MGYLIKEAATGDLVKFETLIKAVDMQQLFSNPYDLTPTQKAGFVFAPVSAFIQVNGTTSYNLFNHLWIYQQGGNDINSTFGKTATNILTPNFAASFIVNIEHGFVPGNKFGNRVANTRDFTISMDIDDSSGNGDGFVTIYGYYLPIFI
jgi:hypothetical protein